MKVKINDFVVGGAKLGTYLSYTDVEPELMVMKPSDRVLPAPFFYEKNLWFHLIRQWLPGENRLFPNGGFEVRDGGGGVRNYDADQVCLHPAIIKHKKTLDKMLRRAEKAQAARERAAKRGSKPPKVKVEGGRRGRPALDPAVKAARDAAKTERSVRSGGKRGRPASTVVRVVSAETKPAGKRGRPSLTSEVIAQRVLKALDDRFCSVIVFLYIYVIKLKVMSKVHLVVVTNTSDIQWIEAFDTLDKAIDYANTLNDLKDHKHFIQSVELR